MGAERESTERETLVETLRNAAMDLIKLDGALVIPDGGADDDLALLACDTVAGGGTIPAHAAGALVYFLADMLEE